MNLKSLSNRDGTRSKVPASIVLALMLAAWLFPVLPAPGAAKFWDGSSSGLFSVGANWVGGVAPIAGDDLVFQAGVTRLQVTNDFSPVRAFNTILFQGSDYIVRGNTLIVTNGISSINPTGPNRIDADILLRGSQAWEAQGATAEININGDVNLNSFTLTVRANTGDFLFSGILSGTGNLVKTNVGSLRLDGVGHNTYSGFTRFDGGVLELAKSGIVSVTPLVFSNFTAIPGPLSVGDGNGLIGTDVLRLLADDQIANTSDVTVRNSALVDLNDHSDRIGSLTMRGGTIETGAGTLILGGDLSTLSDTNTASIEGHLSLGGASRTFDVASGPVAADLRINATISADTELIFTSAGFTKTGGGSLFLAGTNTYNGVTVINDGQLALLSDRALGTTATPLGVSAGTVINNNGNLFLSGVQVTNEALTINGTNPGGAFNSSGVSIWTGDIVLNSQTFISATTSLLLNGAITGSGGFTKLSGGSLTLAGTTANTYTGTTTLRDGLLLLDKDSTTVIGGAMSGPLVIGENELPENVDIVRLLACCQLPDDTDVTINSSGLLDLNGFGNNVRDIILNGGDIAAPLPGSMLPTGNITVNANINSPSIISGRMSLLSSPIIDVTGHSWSPDLNITAQLIGAGTLTKNGPGELGLNGANTYSGVTTINAGLVMLGNAAALGTTAGGTVVNNGAVLDLKSGVHVGNEALTLSGAGNGSLGALSSSAGSNSWAGAITLATNATVSAGPGDFLNLNGPISATSAGNLTKSGTGTLIFSGATGNSYNDTIVAGGILALAKSLANSAVPGDLIIGDGVGIDIVRLDADNQINDSASVSVVSGGRLVLNDQNETTGPIDGFGLIDLGAGVLRVAVNSGSTTFAGLIIGTGDVFKLGVGTWTLTGNNTHSGVTTVSAGTLAVNGSQPKSAVAVNGTATLMGDGVVGDLQVFGTVRPGSSPAILATSNVNFTAQADYFVELNGPDPGPGYDQLNVRGTNQLGGSTLHVSVGPGFAPAEGQEFVIINNDGSEAILGTFNGLPGGSIITANHLQFRIRYSAIFENDVVLTLTNTAARFGSAVVSGGNGDGNIDVNECNFLHVTITNVTGAALSGMTGTLVPKTPGVSVTAGTSAYPNMAAGARGTNSMPFQFSTAPGFVCGRLVEFELVVNTPANGTFAIPFSLTSGSAGGALRFNNSALAAIPDNGTVDIPVSVAGVTTPLKRVVVSLHITHTTVNDLDISLIGPDGTTIVLSSDNGGTSSDYGTDCIDDRSRTTFSDTGTPITLAAAPFVGTFSPEQSLGVFNEKSGAAVNGTWRLRVTDDAPGGVGSVRCWSLVLSPTTCNDLGGACESCPENRTVLGLIGDGSALQTGRLERTGVASSCGVPKTCPGVLDPATQRRYDAYVFENGESNACIRVTLTAPCSLFSAAYRDSYQPTDLCQNYLADAGATVAGGSRSYSFLAAARSRFVVVVHELDSNGGCNYQLDVDGGNCRPRLNIASQPPNRVALDWTSAAAGYVPVFSNALANPPHLPWIPLPGTPTISGGRFRITDVVGPAPTNRFYQLRKP